MIGSKENEVIKSRGKKPVSANRVLFRALRQYNLKEGFDRYQFVLKWREIVGEDIAKRTRPECLRNRALVVRVCDSTWAQELSFQKHIILKRMKRFVPDTMKLDDIVFYVGDDLSGKAA